MKIRWTLTLLGFIGLLGCEKDPDLRPSYVPEEILFSVYDTVSFQNTYGLINNLDLKIKGVYDFGYNIQTIADNIDTIATILNTKSYLTNGDRTFGIIYIDSTIEITTNFFDFDDIDASDWFETVVQLELKEKLTDNFFKWGILNVPTGQEQYWVDELTKHNIIKSASLNHIIYLNR